MYLALKSGPIIPSNLCSKAYTVQGTSKHKHILQAMKTRIPIRLSVTIVALFLCNYLFATTVTVSTLNFTGAGSLNAAITTINASPGPHIIDFSVTGSITATTLLPIIQEDVTINAYDILIDGVFSYQILDIASTSTCIINGLTIKNALAVVGAAISNRGSLTLNEVVLTGNRASDRGGAIYNQGGTTNVNSCTINNNNGGNTGGGGIYNTASGTVHVSNTTISGNFTFGSGGGIRNAGVMTINHATIASNSAFATVAAGGGINNTLNMTMSNTIAYSNTVGFFGTPEDIYSTRFISTPNANLVGACSGVCPSFPYSSNPLLSPVADNGGATPTMALLSTSPAINVGSGSESTDQRVFARDGAPDLGAFEFGAAPVAAGTSITLDLRAILGGATDLGSSVMRSDLRAILPLSDPYGTGRTTTPVVLVNSGGNTIVDWILIEIRDNSSPTTVVFEIAALVQRDGDIVDIDGASDITIGTLPSGTFHVALRHRNHMGVMASSTFTVP